MSTLSTTPMEATQDEHAERLQRAQAAGFATWEEYAAEMQRRMRIREALAAADLPALHEKAMLAGVTLTEPQQRVFTAAAGLLDAGGIVAVIGPRGTGKTLLAGLLLFRHLRQAVSAGKEPARDRAPLLGRYAKVLDFFRQVRETYGREAKATEAQVLAAYARPDLLVLDEVHERTGSDWEGVQLTDLIDRRYAAGDRATLLLSNQQRPALAENLGPSICSRLRERGEVLELAGESYREVLRRQREGGGA